MISLLPNEIVELHRSILELLIKESLDMNEINVLIEGIDVDFNPILDYFFTESLEEELQNESETDYSQPSIMFTSFEGCKGLSACHVFIVGLNKGIMPKLNEENKISDFEVSKFIVAMTRTRKLLYLISNRYDYKPMDGRNKISPFLKLIPEDLKLSSGYIKTDNIPDFINLLYQ